MRFLGSNATEMRTGRRPGLCPGPTRKAYTVHPQTPSRILGAVSWQERERSEGMGWGKGTSRKEKEGRGRKIGGEKEGYIEGECNVAR